MKYIRGVDRSVGHFHVSVSGVVPDYWDGSEEYLRVLLSGNINIKSQNSNIFISREYHLNTVPKIN
jgi:hypothetical protein